MKLIITVIANAIQTNVAQTEEEGKDHCTILSHKLTLESTQSNLIEEAAMENFFSFDLNLDGLISLEEVIERIGSNGTEEGFKQADLDRDGFVKPSEFDFSLK